MFKIICIIRTYILYICLEIQKVSRSWRDINLLNIFPQVDPDGIN